MLFGWMRMIPGFNGVFSVFTPLYVAWLLSRHSFANDSGTQGSRNVTCTVIATSFAF